MQIEKKLYRWKDLRKILTNLGVTFEYSSRGLKFRNGQKTCIVHLKKALTPNMQVTKDIVENMNRYL